MRRILLARRKVRFNSDECPCRGDMSDPHGLPLLELGGRAPLGPPRSDKSFCAHPTKKPARMSGLGSFGLSLLQRSLANVACSNARSGAFLVFSRVFATS